MPDKRGRHDDLHRGLEARRAHRVRAFAQAHRHRAHRVLGQRGDVRNDHDAHHHARRQHVEAGQPGIDLLQQRRDEQQREVAVDDGRHAGQQLEHRLERLARLVAGELGQVDRDDGARAGWRCTARPPSWSACPTAAPMMPKCASENSGVHCVSVRKSHSGTWLKKSSDSLQQHVDDAHRGEYRDAGREQQHQLDDLLAPLAPDLGLRQLRQARIARQGWVGHSDPSLGVGAVAAILGAFRRARSPARQRGTTNLGRHQSLASRASRSSIRTPTSFLPPNTVPFLPLAMCSRPIV